MTLSQLACIVVLSLVSGGQALQVRMWWCDRWLYQASLQCYECNGITASGGRCEGTGNVGNKVNRFVGHSGSRLLYPGWVWSVLWPHEDGDPPLRPLPLHGEEHGVQVEERLHHWRLGADQGQWDGWQDCVWPRLWKAGRPQWGQEEDCKF